MYCCVFYLCLRIKYLFLYFLLFAIIGVFLLNFCSLYMFKFISSISLKFLHFTVFIQSSNHSYYIHYILKSFGNNVVWSNDFKCWNVKMYIFHIYLYSIYFELNCWLHFVSTKSLFYILWSCLAIHSCMYYTQTHLLYNKLVLYIFFSHFIIILKKQIEIVMKAIVKKMWTLRKSDVSALFL